MNPNLTRSLLATTALVLAGSGAFAGEIIFTPVPFAENDAQKRAVLATESVEMNGADISDRLQRSRPQRRQDRRRGLRPADRRERPPGEERRRLDAYLRRRRLHLAAADRRQAVQHHPFRVAPGRDVSVGAGAGRRRQAHPVSTKPIDFSAYGGLWVPCAGSVTPWGTHLGSEEYPPDARAVEAATALDEIDDYYMPMVRYFGLDPGKVTLDEFKAAFKPVPLRLPDRDHGQGGRLLHRRQALCHGPRRGRTRQGHARPEDRLHLRRRHQCRPVHVRRRHRRQSRRRHALRRQMEPDLGGGRRRRRPLLDRPRPCRQTPPVAEALDRTARVLRPLRDRRHRRRRHLPGGLLVVERRRPRRVPEGQAGHGAGSPPGWRPAATPRCWAPPPSSARKRASLSIRPARRCSSPCRKSATAWRTAPRTASTTRAAATTSASRANACGAVYALTLGTDAAIGSDYVASATKALVAGKPTNYDDGSPYAGNTCDIDGIANPDNITFMDGLRHADHRRGYRLGPPERRDLGLQHGRSAA